jgi:hypothetical protein
MRNLLGKGVYIGHLLNMIDFSPLLPNQISPEFDERLPIIFHPVFLIDSVLFLFHILFFNKQSFVELS